MDGVHFPVFDVSGGRNTCPPVCAAVVDQFRCKEDRAGDVLQRRILGAVFYDHRIDRSGGAGHQTVTGRQSGNAIYRENDIAGGSWGRDYCCHDIHHYVLGGLLPEFSVGSNCQ